MDLVDKFLLEIVMLEWATLECSLWLNMPLDVTVCRACADAIAIFSALNASVCSLELVADMLLASCAVTSPALSERCS